MSYSVLTPLLIPPELRGKKSVNIGDGFILKSITNLLLPHQCQYTYTSRKLLVDDEIDKINSTKALILAGANQLNDNFTILPGMNLDILEQIKVPIVPFGIGVHGVKKYNRGMSDLTKEILKYIHQRIKFSAWRCPLTIEYLTHHLPELRAQFLLTGCPVMYDEKILSHSSEFSDDVKTVVVTVTERHDFWERETQTIDFVSENYRSAQKVLSLHQDFLELQNVQVTKFWKSLQIKILKQYEPTPFSLREYAKHRGFQIFNPQSVDDFLSFYKNCDLHIGSRLHAHLYFLSQSKKSLLTYVDERCVGFAQLLDFPICDFNYLAKYLDYNFETYRHNCIHSHKGMHKFVNYLQKEIL
ncbi:MAG: polysaccharide pyruvyl transferase family protein [Goleter apudmare HA4340-LM2]|jgi:hypothetical protein|nr:polysaccharide pyruvyl transferase family protein [Goleter apudmare HA4340-LM2]